MAAGGGSVSARGLALSVAHRLKYYIDVQRKENSFDSSGFIRDEIEGSSFYTHPACLIEREQARPLEHDFAEIKLEASLRTYTGSTKECYQKVQKCPEKQKDLEKFIKEMARDYVPDQTNEGRVKKTQRQSYLLHTPSGLHRTATPSMSAEEVRRLVSSASKLIVAATSDVSPKALETTREGVSSPKRRATKSIPSVDFSWKQSLSSTLSHKDEAESSMQECREEFKTELNEKCSDTKGRKKLKSTKKRKNAKYKERAIETSSSVSRNSYKSNRVLSTMFPKSNDLCSVSVSFPSPYSPLGPCKVFRKGILKNRRSLSCTSSEISESQNRELDSHWKGYLHYPAGTSGKPVEMKRKKLSCFPIRAASRRSFRSSKPLAGEPVLTSGNTPEIIRNNMEVCSVKQRAEAMHAQTSKVSKKTEKTYSSKEVSGFAVLNKPGEEMHEQDNWKSEFPGKSQRDRPEETEGGLNSASAKNSEGHRVHFQVIQPWYDPKNAEQKHNSDSRSLDSVRLPENTTLPIVPVEESIELLACLQDQDKDHVLRVTCEPSLGYQVSQGGDQDAPAGLAMNESMNIDGAAENQDTKGNLLNQILSLNEVEAVEDPTSHMQIHDFILGEPWDQQVTYIPPVLLSPSEESSSASSGMSTPVRGRLRNEESDEEFTISSASRCSSVKSLGSTESRNTSAGLKEREENGDSSAEIHAPSGMQGSTAVQQGTFDQQSEKLSSSAEEKGTGKGCGPENRSATQVVYFSHLPISF